ncbi:MBL fold metallo-hydrolase [Mesomycoplasma molare]|uniref:MBL fold metallo-hydrolase n=1 Tax=Mesomycoplasma molare TaxID=171288 RepID=A0ABY5TUM2_9BACT|nr:MBL fold metallo-hydrolase [Mesomycoplasma molare]UWD34034.1 MBL fold metallo-hydrolase [Mesomycoplasma molare]
MYIKSYGSSSKGNAYYIVTNQAKRIIIDLGLDVLKNKQSPHYEHLLNVDYVFISHEHVDHTRHLKKFLENNLKAKVHIAQESFEKLCSKDKWFWLNKARFFWTPLEKAGAIWTNKDFQVTSIKVEHNSKANFGYFIDFYNGENILYITDCGSINLGQFKNLDFKDLKTIMIESNYDDEREPTAFSIKEETQRSMVGHFSYKQSMKLISFIFNKIKDDAKNYGIKDASIIEKLLSLNVFLIHTSAKDFNSLKNKDIKQNLNFIRIAEKGGEYNANYYRKRSWDKTKEFIKAP